MRMIIVLLVTSLALGFLVAPSAWGAEARLLTAADIAGKLGEAGFTVDKRHVELDEPIRMMGEHHVPIRLHPDVRPEIKVNVEREE